jgi:Mg/Co/Ni transporter MgtE
MMSEMSEVDRLCADFALRYPDAFARTLGHGDMDECEQIVQSLPAEQVAGIVARLPAAHIRHLLDAEQLQPVSWLAAAPFDDAVSLLSRLKRERRLALINALADTDRQRALLRHQQYPAHSIGALVSDIPLLLAAVSQAKDVVNDLRNLEPEAVGPIVVVDIYGRYLGVLDRLRLLLRSPPTGNVEDYLLELTPVRPETPASAVALDDAWHTHNWLPVVDHRQRVVGVVLREKVMRAASDDGGREQSTSTFLLDLLDELVFLCDHLLHRLYSRGGAP